jgi:hypothetical protein
MQCMAEDGLAPTPRLWVTLVDKYRRAGRRAEMEAVAMEMVQSGATGDTQLWHQCILAAAKGVHDSHPTTPPPHHPTTPPPHHATTVAALPGRV